VADDPNSSIKSGLSNLRPWQKGESGNPAGRPPKGYATADKLRAALAEEVPAILERLVAAAMRGDIAAARTILERVLPPLKAVEAPVILAPLLGTLTDQGRSILQATGSGGLAPGQAAQLLAALASQAKLTEVDEIARRLAALEARMGVDGAKS
jgi:hypothetical protein